MFYSFLSLSGAVSRGKTLSKIGDTLCLLPGLAMAAEGVRDGVYDGFDCAAPVSELRLTLTGNRIRFYESLCDLTNPVAVRNMEGAHLFDVHCAGEGMEWETRFLLMQGFDDALIIVGPQWADQYQRCDKGE